LTYHGHVGSVIDVAWSPDSRHIASSGSDQTVQVWDALTGVLLLISHGHSAQVYQVAFAPDGTRIASGSDDTTVQICQAL